MFDNISAAYNTHRRIKPMPMTWAPIMNMNMGEHHPVFFQEAMGHCPVQIDVSIAGRVHMSLDVYRKIQDLVVIIFVSERALWHIIRANVSLCGNWKCTLKWYLIWRNLGGQLHQAKLSRLPSSNGSPAWFAVKTGLIVTTRNAVTARQDSISSD